MSTLTLQKQKENISTLEKHLSYFIKRKKKKKTRWEANNSRRKYFFSFSPKADKSNYLI